MQNKTKKTHTQKKRTQKSRVVPNHPKIIIGKLYAEWCGHCKDLKPEWTEACEKLKLHMGEEVIKIVDIEQSNEVAQINQINTTYLKMSPVKLSVQGGYPTIYKIQNGKVSYYNGDRTAGPMEKWVMGVSQQDGGRRTKRSWSEPERQRRRATELRRCATHIEGVVCKTQKRTRRNQSWFSFFLRNP